MRGKNGGAVGGSPTGRAAPTVGQRLEAKASRAHGVITRAEALAVGVSRHQVQRRLRDGSLLPLYPGVYRLGHRAPSTEAEYTAAVKACGKGAGISGLAGAYLLGMIRDKPRWPEVTAPTDRRIPGVVVHRARRTGLQLTHVRGVPVTSPAQIMVDIAGRLSGEELAAAGHEALVRYNCTPDRVMKALELRPNAPGAEKLRRVLNGEERVSLSALERRFLLVLRRERLLLPETNIKASGRFVDCRWPALSLTVELDSYRFHSSRQAWERDRRRERDARRRGDELLRYTYGDVFEDQREMLHELRPRLKPQA